MNHLPQAWGRVSSERLKPECSIVTDYLGIRSPETTSMVSMIHLTYKEMVRKNIHNHP